jgi:hypothetical protein
MWRAIVLAVVACFSASSVAGPLSVPEAGVTFEAPFGFTALSPEEIAIKFPRRNAPQSVVGNERRTTTIAYELRDVAVPEDALPAVLESMATSFHRAVPGLEWKRREIVKMVGQDWIWLEMTSTALDADIYNIVLMTPRRGKLLVFNFNATKALFAIQESALRASIASIRFE